MKLNINYDEQEPIASQQGCRPPTFLYLHRTLYSYDHSWVYIISRRLEDEISNVWVHERRMMTKG